MVLARRLERRGHSVALAPDGATALELIRQDSFDVVLLDIMMPGIDGIEVLRRVRERYSPSDLPVIMATAKHESADIVEALKLGASDYVTKPIDFPVLLARVQTQLSLKHATQALESANNRMKRDLEAAATVQRALLPKRAPTTGGVQFAWAYQPCGELGGDLLNVFAFDDRHVGLYVLDVSGHGTVAALLSVTVARNLTPLADRSSVVTDPSDGPAGFKIVAPAEVVRRLNQIYRMEPEEGQFFTLLYGVLNTETGHFEFAVAGHPDPIIAPQEGTSRVYGSPGGVPVGMMDAWEFEGASLRLNPGDRLYLYSDGLFEVHDSTHTQMGLEGVQDIVATTRDESLDSSVDSLLQAAFAWRGSENLADDVSIVAAEMPPVDAEPGFAADS